MKNNVVTVTVVANLYEEKKFRSCRQSSVCPPTCPTNSSSHFCLKNSVCHRQKPLTYSSGCVDRNHRDGQPSQIEFMSSTTSMRCPSPIPDSPTQFSSQSSSILWSTLSNAALRSSNTKTEMCLNKCHWGPWLEQSQCCDVFENLIGRHQNNHLLLNICSAVEKQLFQLFYLKLAGLKWASNYLLLMCLQFSSLGVV